MVRKRESTVWGNKAEGDLFVCLQLKRKPHKCGNDKNACKHACCQSVCDKLQWCSLLLLHLHRLNQQLHFHIYFDFEFQVHLQSMLLHLDNKIIIKIAQCGAQTTTMMRTQRKDAILVAIGLVGPVDVAAFSIENTVTVQ